MTTFRWFCAFFLAACLLLPVQAQGLRPAPWSLSMGHEADLLGSGYAPWQTSRVALQRRFATGAVAVEAGRVARFERAAAFGSVDAYHTLWRGAYGNVRVLKAPKATTAAHSDVSAEVFQNLPGGWEVSAGARQMAFADDEAWLATASAARYIGAWLIRARGLVRLDADRVVVSPSVSARWLRERPEGVVPVLELAGGQGREVVPALGDAPAALRRSWFVLGRAEWPLSRGMALQTGLRYTTDAPAARVGVEAGLTLRW